MKKILLVSVFSLLSLSSHSLDFFGAVDEANKQTSTQTTTESTVSNGDYAKSLINSTISAVASSPEQKKNARKSGLSVEQQKIKERREFLKEQIGKQKANLKLVKSLETFMREDKKIIIGKSKYVDIYIPFNHMSTLEFDRSVKSFSLLQQPGVVIRQKVGVKNKIEILNKNPSLKISTKILFDNDQEINFIIQTGKSSTKRFIDYKIFTDNQSVASKTLFVKPTKMKHIHNDFNNKAIYLILSRIDKNPFYSKLRENMFAVDQVLHSGPAEVETLYGIQKIDYSLILNNIYESPYLQSDKKDSRIKKRLILMESTITNNSNTDNLTVNETLIKNRFGNYVAFWLGNLDTKENIISPKQSLRFLLVIEDVVQ